MTCGNFDGTHQLEAARTLRMKSGAVRDGQEVEEGVAEVTFRKLDQFQRVYQIKRVDTLHDELHGHPRNNGSKDKQTFRLNHELF